MKLWPFEVLADAKGKPNFQVSYRGESQLFTPEQISSFVLQYMKKTAENYIGSPVNKAVITVPAYFNDSQRAATKAAGTISGLEVLRIINEPTAAAIAYGLNAEGQTTVLIFDLGGGTFDVSLLSIEDGIFEVKATAGDTHLGGEDFDNALVQFFVNDFKKKNPGEDMSQNQRALRRLRTAAERAKRTLSTELKTSVQVDSLHNGIDYHGNISRARFETLCNNFFMKCLAPVEQVLMDSGCSREQIDQVVMVGGSTRIPKVQSLISQFFGGRPNNYSINPDEAVAHGAAVQAAILTDSAGDLDCILVDVTPLSLGLETQGGMMKVIIPRNTTIPTTARNMFSTAVDNQDAVYVQIFEGERPETKDCHLLGRFALGDIPPAPRGQPKIMVTFDLDADGLLNVTAVEKSKGTSKHITITNDQGRLSAEQIEKMVADAAKFKVQDEAFRREHAVKSKLNGFIVHIGRVIKDSKYRDVLDSKDRDSLTTAGTTAIRWVKAEGEGASAEEHKAQLTALMNVAIPILKRLDESMRKARKTSAAKAGDDDEDMD
jgi:L1 cell adhesion molecule like protein